MKVLLLHRFLNPPSVMDPLARALEAEGHTCHVVPFVPPDARDGLEALANQLEGFVARVTPGTERFAIVAFSMGALVARIFLQRRGGSERVAAFFSIAGPHAGTIMAHLFRTRGAHEMRPGSRLLAALDSMSGNLNRARVTCYWSPCDLVTLPRKTNFLAGAEHVRIFSLTHTLLLRRRKLHHDIARRLRAIVDRSDDMHVRNATCTATPR